MCGPYSEESDKLMGAAFEVYNESDLRDCND